MTKSDPKKELELYVHIPFCVQKCKYCDFLSAPASGQVQNAYMDALIREIEQSAERIESGAYRVTSVFIGGGTPSVTDEKRIMEVMDAVRSGYELDPDAEVSIEVNPGSVSPRKLLAYRAAGINRLSIGCQSASDRELQKLGRIHTTEQFLATYAQARLAGFRNINVDLMSALPGQELNDWKKTLQFILALPSPPEHISAYSLMIEENTPFYEMAKAGELILPSEEEERQMYWYTHDCLEKAGYAHYEISNYARPGYECRHNLGYWTRREYLGFGIGAASLFDNTRFCNMEDLERYTKDPSGCRTKQQTLSRGMQMEETMFLGLRLLTGVSVKAFRELYGAEMVEIYGKELAESMEEGLMEQAGEYYRLTRRGVDLSNFVMAKFLRDET